MGTSETLFLSGTLSINNVSVSPSQAALAVSVLGDISAALSIFCFSVAMLSLGQAIGGNFIRVKLVPQMLRYPMSGNAVLALAGVLMLVGY